MEKKKIILKVLVIDLTAIILGYLIIKRLTKTKYKKVNIMSDITLKVYDYFNPCSTNGKSIAETRDFLNKAVTEFIDKPIPFLNIKDMDIITDSNKVPVRIYTPPSRDKFPIIIYSHGGSWISGNLYTHDNICRKLSKKTNSIVIAVDYRLAPEYPFPAGLNDVYNVLQWVFKNAESIHGNPNHICMAGDSAGGNLSAAVSQMSYDKTGPHITCQVLIYPSTNIFQLNSKSGTHFCNDNILTRKNSQKYLSLYTPKIQDRKNKYASPILAKNFKGLPNTLVITAEFDPLRDEGEAYAQKLKRAGVPSTFIRYKGVTHGFLSMDRIFKQAEEALNEISLYLQKEFNKN